MDRQDRSLGIWLIWIIAWIVTVISVLTCIRNGAQYSQDFQWSPTRLLLQHIDPWEHALAGNQDQAIILSQGPNYAHFFYLLLSSVGLMTFPVARIVWAICNLIFAIATLVLIKSIFRQGRTEWAISCVFFLCSTAFRNTVGNGQMPLITLCFVALAFAANKSWSKALWIGFSYCKYSFAPPYFFDMLFSRPYGIVVLTFVPATLGLLWAHWMVGGNWLHLAVEPLLVGVNQNGPGSSDWMAVSDAIFGKSGEGGALLFFIKYVLPVSASMVVVWHVKHRRGADSVAETQAATAIYGIAALLLFRHLPYDYVFLIFAFAFGLKHLKQTPARWLVVGVLYFWFGLKLEDIFIGRHVLALLYLNFIILGSMLITAMRVKCGIPLIVAN